MQAAITKQKIKEEEMQIKVVERAQQINLQTQEITRRERELDATVRKPAEAEKYKMEKLADAHRNKIILEAQAEAEAIKVRFCMFSWWIYYENLSTSRTNIGPLVCLGEINRGGLESVLKTIKWVGPNN